MTDINWLSAQAEFSPSDLLAFWSARNGDTRKGSLSALTDYLRTVLSASGSLVTQYSAPNASGFTVAVGQPQQSTFLLLTPNAGYAAGTITLSASPVDGQELLVTTTQSVSTLTVSGGTINGAPTTLAANAFFRLRYDGVLGAWYRVG